MRPVLILCLSAVALAAGVTAAHFISSGTVLSLLTQAVIYAVFAQGVGVLMRQNGMVSFGHALFFGVTGYALGLLLQVQGLPPEAAIVLAVALVTVVAFVLGLVIVRVPGIAFGMLTLALGQACYLSASRSRGLMGGTDGMNINWPSSIFGAPVSALQTPAAMFLLCWVVLVLVITGLSLVMRGGFGAVTEAVRDNEERARFIGIRTLMPRALVFALSAFVTSLGGVLAAFNTGFVSPESLHWSVSGVALMMVIIGGTRAMWGPALGAIVYFLFKDVLGDYAEHWMAIFGVALIAVTVFFPRGLAGSVSALASRFTKGGPAVTSGAVTQRDEGMRGTRRGA